MLGIVDFSGVDDAFKPLPVGDYDGQTKGWKAEPAKNGKSTNIIAEFVINYEDEETGAEKKRTMRLYWNLSEKALWRVKRDMVDLGADPASFNPPADEDGKRNVNLEAILKDIFGGAPKPVTLSLILDTYTPIDPATGEPKIDIETGEHVKVETNRIDRVKLRWDGDEPF